MAWDAVAENMAVNVIAKVEGAGAWDAINYNDPITIGVMQWFGTRAAGLLKDIEAGNPAQYALIAQSLRDDVASNPANDGGYWPRRWLSRPEGDSLKPVLRAVKDIQGQLIASDIADYKRVIEGLGVNVDTHTNMAIFWMCMYHQTPRRAIDVLKIAGLKSSLDNIYAVCYNYPVFRDYRSRYTQARDIIASGIAPDLVDLNDEGTETGDDGGGGGLIDDTEPVPLDPQRVNFTRVEVVGDNIHVHGADGKVSVASPSGGNNYFVTAVYDGKEVEPNPLDPEDVPDPDPAPDPPTGDDAQDKRNALKKFMVDRIGTLKYSQAMNLRYPISSGYCDCSSLTRSAYEAVLGINPGSYTDAQVSSKETRLIEKGGGGNSPDESKMKVGDLVISARYGTSSNRIASHVEMYIGNGEIIGHGGIPYMGPTIKNLAARTADKKTWWVKRANGL